MFPTSSKNQRSIQGKYFTLLFTSISLNTEQKQTLLFTSISLNTEQKQTVDDITNRTVKLENVLASLEVKIDSNDTDLNHKQSEKKLP